MQGGHKAPAAGWIKKVEWLTGKGLFADVDWTDAAKAHIDAQEYRFISPVITYDASGKVTGFQLAALTNHPGLLGMEPAMAAALSAFAGEHTTEQESNVTLLSALIAGLGLKAEATEAEVITAVAALKAQVAAPPKVPEALVTSLKLKPDADMTAACSAVAALVATDTAATTTIAALQGEIATLKAKGAGDEVAAAVDKALADGKLLPAQKDWALTLGRKDMAALTGFIASAPKLAPGQTQTQGDPDPQNQAALSAQQAEVFASFGIKPDAAKEFLAKQKATA
jgi:phage I-like protein